MSRNKTLKTKFYKLERLINWEHVHHVNDQLLKGVSPHKVSDWCKENGFSISHPKLYEYKNLLQEAITKDITVEKLLEAETDNRSPVQLKALGVTEAKNMVKDEMELLDAIIQRGFTVLTNNPNVGIKDAMQAIEMKNKLTGGRHGGLTGYGLDHLKKMEQAKFEAIVELVMQYLPEDKHEELEKAIADAERRFYEEEAPELLEQYEEAMQDELDSANSEIVSDE